MEEQLKLKIESVVYPGRGLSRTDGFVVFVDGVIADEVVLARITKRHKNFAEAELIEVLEPSPHRVSPICPLYGRCGGCRYQHMTYAEEVQTKHSQLAGFFSHAMRNEPPVSLRDPVRSPLELGYRNKINLHGATYGEKSFLGYYAMDNTTLLDVESCPLAINELNKRLSEIRADEDSFKTATNTRASLMLRYTPHDGALNWSGTDTDQLITETLPFGDIQVQCSGFFQVNPSVTPLLTEQVMKLLKEISPENLLDLYCGCGLFSIAGALAGVPRITGLEINRGAIAAARLNAKKHGLTGIDFVRDSVEHGLPPAFRSLNAAQTAVLVDPPRRGLEKTILKSITETKPAHMIYISCAADTMARDTSFLQKAGYRIIFSQLFDMFPRTSYFESVTYLSTLQ